MTVDRFQMLTGDGEEDIYLFLQKQFSEFELAPQRYTHY